MANAGLQGRTTIDDKSKELELSFDNLQHDFLAMIEKVFPDPTSAPHLVVGLFHSLRFIFQPWSHSLFLIHQLMGHSMGASPTISCAPILQKKGYKVVGVVVLDVVEGKSGASDP